MSKKTRLLRRIFFVSGNVLIVIFSTLTALVCTSALWMFKTWPYLTMQELMFTIQSPVEGTNRGMVMEYIWSCIPVTIIIMTAVIAALIITKKKRGYRIAASVIPVLTVVVLIIIVYTAWQKLDITDYITSKNTYSSFIDDNYADPAKTKLTFPEKKRNLIYIYLESMETTYADKKEGGAFSDNYIPELTELAQENEDFSGDNRKINGGVPLNSTTWTAAALFAQTSGLPLTIPIEGNSMDTQNSFFPGMVALGDILEQQGYNQRLLIGSDGNFGGRSLYFSQHGNYDIRDYYYYQQLGKFPQDYWVWWGYEDQKLFQYAKEELLDISKKDKPFNFTMLTVDTHFENGYVCDLCGTENGENQYANVISCSSRQVYEFVKWIQQQDFYDNTTIVISGDHLTMDADFCQNVDKNYERKVYTTYINAAVQPEKLEWRREYSTFDQFPTTLAGLGVEIQGERLGLGTNLFSAKQTLTEVYGVDYVNRELQKKSDLMTKFTKSIDTENEEVRIREGRSVTADAQVLPYDYQTGKLQIIINNIQNVEDNIASITAAVWTKEDQTDLQWIQAEDQADESYLLNINVPSFGYATGNYYIDIYLTDVNANQYLVAQTTGYVE